MKTTFTLASLLVLPVAFACAADDKPAKPKRDPAAIFKVLDKDGDNGLTFDEWKSGMAGQIDPSRQPDIFKKKDADGDGKLTLAEFMFVPPREPVKVPTVPGKENKPE